MSDLAYGTQDSAPAYKAGLTNWGAIWAGVFTFAAIWAVFEALAVAIFGAGFSMGMAIWTIVLTVIAMYIAGLETGRLADVANRHDGLIHGVIMFGLSVVSAALLMSVANGLFAGGAPAHSSSFLAMSPGAEWAEFIGLILGWLAAMGGASIGAGRRAEIRQAAQQPLQMHPAA